MEELTTPRPPLTPAQKKRRAAEAKGKRLELQIRAYLESRGWLVETAPKVMVWIWNPVKGARAPISTRHDFFGVWDGMAVNEQSAMRSLYQVTTLAHVARKRNKIHDSGFPVTLFDSIYAYVGRPGRWRVFRGPDFAMPGEAFTWTTPTTKSKPQEVAAA